MSKKFEIVGSDISDGYHTFDELYEHRNLLFMNLCVLDPQFSCWKRDPGTPGWFILYWESPSGQISYHIQERLLPLIEARVREDQNKKWDGHASQDVTFRLRNNALRGKE